MKNQNDTLIIIPAYNEEGNISQVIEEVRSTNYSVDIIVINDGSTDGTETAARTAGAEVVTLPFNLGIGAAVQTGFKFAFRKGYDYVIQLDGDGQHIATEIAKILEPAKQGQADMVIGSRYLGERTYKTPLMRRIGMIVFSLVNTLVAGKKVTDNTSGFRVFNREVIRYLSAYYPSDYPEPETIVLLARSKFSIMEVPVEMRQREAGESSINSLRAVYYMLKVLLAIFIDLFKTYPKRAYAEK
ncbi:MAG: glycosyltransferase family 2 protein [bacterium]